jgi:hypothetical protein
MTTQTVFWDPLDYSLPRKIDPGMFALDPAMLMTNAGRRLRLTRIVKYVRKCAAHRNLEFNLSVIEAARMILAPCFYCGHTPDILDTSPNPYNGIDRVDSNQGYTHTNVVSACYQCNMAKHIMSQDDFFSLVKRIYTKQNFNQGS